MDHSKLILIIPALFIFGLIVVHSLRVNGSAVTRKFFFWCFVFCFTKEAINANSLAPEDFSKGFEILNTSLMVPFGWVIAIYLSWFLAESILNPHGRNVKKVLPTVALSSIIITCISLMVECSGGNMRWWWWNYDVPGLWHENRVLRMPVKIIGGWGTTNLIFMSFFMVYVISPWRRVRNKALKIAVVFLSISVPLGILASNLIWRQIFVAPFITFVVFLILFLPKLRDLRAMRGRSPRVLTSARKLRGRQNLD